MTDAVRPQLTERRAFAFGTYILDPVRRLLWCDGAIVPITDKAFDVLATLVANHDRPLEKEELLRRVWPGTFVQENNLVRHVSMVRRALGQAPEQHDYIVTLPGFGYRFVAAVREIDAPDELPTDTGHEHRSESARPSHVTESSNEPAHAALTTPDPATRIGDVAPAGDGSEQTTGPWGRVRGGAQAFGRRPAARLLWAAAAVGGIAVAAISVLTRNSAPIVANRALRQMTYGPDVQLGPTWAPDGRSFAFASNRSGDFEIWVQPTDRPDPIRVTSSEGADWQPSWSPDGRLLAFRSERAGSSGIYVISPRGEGLQQVSKFGHRPSWSPDSSLLLFQSGQVERLRPQPYVVGLDGSAPLPARPDLTQGWLQVRAAWHPSGDLTLWGRDAEGAWTMVKAPVKGGVPVRYGLPTSLVEGLEAQGLTLKNFAWSPSGEYIYFEGAAMQVRNLWRVRVNPATLAWAGAPERLTLGDGADSEVAVIRDGSSLAFSVIKERTRLWAFPLNGSTDPKAGQPLTAGGAGEFDAAVSPNGRVLVYRTVRAGRQELWARSIPENTERLLISGTEWLRSSPRLSADGKRVAYRLTPVASRRAKPAVAVLEANGVEVVVSAPGSPAFTPSDWSPDDKSIIGLCSPAGTPQSAICSLAATPNSAPTVMLSEANREFFSARYSPNQRWIMIVERVSPRRPVWPGAISVFPASGGPRVQVTDGKSNDEKPRWSADGRVIYFVSDRGGFLNVWGRRFNPETGIPEGDVFQVTRFNDPTRMLPVDMSQVETSVSGRQLFLPLTEMTSTIWSLDGIDK